MKRISLFTFMVTCLFCLTSNQAYAQIVTKQLIKSQRSPGEKIPELTFESIVQGPELKEFDNSILNGKIVILEFWGTWCAPCIKQFPKLNRLASRFSEDELIILSITDESEDIVRPFLKRRPLKTWVVSDTDKSVIDDFGVNVFPTTVIIDKEGKVHEYAKIDELDEIYFQNLLESQGPKEKVSFNIGQKSPNAKVKTIRLNEPKKSEPGASLYNISIEKDSTTGPQGSLLGKKMGLVQMKGWSIRKAIANAYNISETLIEGNDKLLNTTINVNVTMPRNQENLVDILLQEGLKKKFNLAINTIEKEVELLALSAPGGLSNYLKEPTSTKGKFSADDGVVAARHWTLKGLVRNIELALGESVYDDTGLKARYDYDLYWEHNNSESLIKALKEQLGLILEKKVMTLETLKVAELPVKDQSQNFSQSESTK